MKDKLEQHRRHLAPEERDRVWWQLRARLDADRADGSGASRGFGWRIPVTAVGALCVVIIALVVARRSDELPMESARWGEATDGMQMPREEKVGPDLSKSKDAKRVDTVPGHLEAPERKDETRSRSSDLRVADDVASDEMSGKEAGELQEEESAGPSSSGPLDSKLPEVGAETTSPPSQDAFPPAPTAQSEPVRDAPAPSPTSASVAIDEELSGSANESGAPVDRDRVQTLDPAWFARYRSHPRVPVREHPAVTIELDAATLSGLERVESAQSASRLPDPDDVPIDGLIASGFEVRQSGGRALEAENRGADPSPLSRGDRAVADYGAKQTPGFREEARRTGRDGAVRYEAAFHPLDPVRVWLALEVEAVEMPAVGDAPPLRRSVQLRFDPAAVAAYRVLGQQAATVTAPDGEAVRFAPGDAPGLAGAISDTRADEAEGGEVAVPAAPPQPGIVLLDLWLTADDPEVLGWVEVDGRPARVIARRDVRPYAAAAPALQQAVTLGLVGELLIQSPWARSVDLPWLRQEIDRWTRSAGADLGGDARVGSLVRSAQPLLEQAQTRSEQRQVERGAEAFYP